VVRGGAWYFVSSFSRSALRFKNCPDGRAGCFGFRVAADVSPKAP
jgi:formylglycine-generating enzyme required for sulfatase activity